MSDPFENGDILRLQAVIADYVWRLDMADIDGMLELFADDAVFEDTAGNVYDGKDAMGGYFRSLVARPEFRGRQHHIDHTRYEATADGYLTRSYWTVTKWYSAENVKRFDVTGHSLDRFVRAGKSFKFAERRVHYWRDIDCPWKPGGTAV
ncbi:MAG TPA: nuclear transport factor 2 family protein [Rhizobiaceae bacterium]|nr:nuclear transport factor 2 family protein [Rhizobiaceae bacterium]